MTRIQKNTLPVVTAGLALAIAALFPLASQAQTPASPGHSGMAASSGTGGGTDMKAMMKDNDDKMSAMQTTGDTDVDFAMMMRIHHQGAITMAEAELKDGKEPQMKKMARDIIAAQKKEIAQFDKFLAKHKK
jgi:uncharacterized protein (DUF305 family)